MKINREAGPPIIIGKRVAVGAAINSSLAVVAHFIPQHAPALISLGVPLTFAVQVWLVNRFGVTQ